MPRAESSRLTSPSVSFDRCVVHGQELDLEILELLLIAAFLEANFFLRLQNVGGCDAQDVADPHEAQTLGHEDDVECLIPGSLHESDRDVPGDFVTRDDVEVADLGNQAKHVGDLDILEVERDASSAVFLAID